MANIADFLLWAIWGGRLFKDSETPAWLRLSTILLENLGGGSCCCYYVKVKSTPSYLEIDNTFFLRIGVKKILSD